MSDIVAIQDLGPQDAKNAISGTSRRHARQKPHTLEHRPRRTLRRQAMIKPEQIPDEALPLTQENNNAK